jgi:hypothetical protein
MARILGLVVLLVPLLVVLTVVMSLGWLVLAGLTSVGWIAQRVVQIMARIVRHA